MKGLHRRTAWALKWDIPADLWMCFMDSVYIRSCLFKAGRTKM